MLTIVCMVITDLRWQTEDTARIGLEVLEKMLAQSDSQAPRLQEKIAELGLPTRGLILD